MCYRSFRNLPQATRKRRHSDDGTTIDTTGYGHSGGFEAGGNDVSGTGQSNAIHVPHVLQGEIARLDQKFKVSLDQSTLATVGNGGGGTGSGGQNAVIRLVCCLDDRHLPCVPPISIVIPENYPMVAPACKLNELEYSATPFLKRVQNALVARIAKLPRMHSLSHLLDTWEMSVRQACAPQPLDAEPVAVSALAPVGNVAATSTTSTMSAVQPSLMSVRLGV